MRNYLSKRNEGNVFNGLFDVWDDFFKPTLYAGNGRMDTDVKETEKGYELSVDMPGYDKKDVNISLENGYITVSAKREEKEEDGAYIRRERSFSCSRSFYVGDSLTEEDIKAKYDNGTLVISVPKKKEEIPQKKSIEIE